MTSLRHSAPGLALAIVFSYSPLAAAQGLSSGSGAGTGTGAQSGTTQPLPGAGRFDPLPRGPMPRIRPNQSVPLGPGATVTYPGEDVIIPLNSVATPGDPKATELSHITELQLNYARRIPDPGERSLALSRIAIAATFSSQLDLAEQALSDASTAAFQMTGGMVQDQRLISIIAAFTRLAEDRLREGAADPTFAAPPAAEGNTPPAALPKIDRPELIRRARTDLQRAAELTERLGNRTFRFEEMARVASAMALGSQRIVSDFPADAGDKKDPSGLTLSYAGLPDKILQDAAGLAAKIDRPVWHDQAMVNVAAAAADSLQFARALAVARLIPLPEVRTNALLKIAETQARRGDPSGSTTTYREAAVAVASIPQDDPRAVLAGVLIDNLISVGRFEDARASIALYPDASRQLIALGAIAESQGRRGATRSALTWINQEVPGRYRSWLYRRVNNGVVAAIEDNRGKDLSNRAP